MGLMELLEIVQKKWREDESGLQDRANEITQAIKNHIESASDTKSSQDFTEKAYQQYTSIFDPKNGGFGRAPKFPTAHNLLFLMEYYSMYQQEHALHMTETTLVQMYRGGIFDHIGYGFSRYSTDDIWLAPHFEKMLYDNALLLMAYSRAYAITEKPLYKDIALKIIEYVIRELQHPDGGFYSAQDADSDRVEGKFYLLTPREIIQCIGEKDGEKFNTAFDITEKGNFEGKSIPNLLKTPQEDWTSWEKHLPALRTYRRERYHLHKDDKILSAWNGLMIAAMAQAHRLLKESPAGSIISHAKKAASYIEENLIAEGEIFTSFREGRRSTQGFLDDYAFMGLGMLEMYLATLDGNYLRKATEICQKAVELFFDKEQVGFNLSGIKNEQMIFNLKEVYDGAMPSGNSVMAYNMVMLSKLGKWEDEAAVLEKHLEFMNSSTENYPAGHSFFGLAMLESRKPVYQYCTEDGCIAI